MLSHVIAMGAGRETAELLFTNARLVNVFSGDIETIHVGVGHGMIVGIGPEYRRARQLKLAVVKRHRGMGNIGLVTGFGLQAGALASSVGDDSHNLIAVGVDDGDLLCALREVSRLGGGLAVCAGGRGLSSLALPIAGLMAHAPLAQVTGTFQALHRRVQRLGYVLTRPFIALSFLALPVILELRLTDRGLVDVERACFVPLYAA